VNTPRRVRYQHEKKGIIHDKDGSLTNMGPNTYAAGYFKHLEQPECRVDMQVFDGVVCDNSVQIRRVAFHAVTPNSMNYMPMRVLRYDDALLSSLGALEKEKYIADKSHYGRVRFTEKLDPGMAWAMPVVTGHKYRIQWTDDSALDWMNLKLELSHRWTQQDKQVYFVQNFTDTRVGMNVKYTNGASQTFENNTILSSPSLWTSG
jgi:hypothetical protein